MFDGGVVCVGGVLFGGFAGGGACGVGVGVVVVVVGHGGGVDGRERVEEVK